MGEKGSEVSLKSTVEMWARSVLVYAQVYKGALIAEETSQISCWTTCSVCQ